MRVINILKEKIREIEQIKTTVQETIRTLSLRIEDAERTKKDRLIQIEELNEEIKEIQESIKIIGEKL